MGEPVPLKITVTSSKDFADLYLEINTGNEVTLDGPQTWEKNLSNPTFDRGVAHGNFTIKAGQSLTFNRVLHFPQREGYYYISAEVLSTGRMIDAIDSFRVLLTQEDGGQILLAGTPRPPHTPNVTIPVYGPGTPTPAFEIEPTSTSEATPIPLHGTTPVGPPYPQPSPPVFPLVSTDQAAPTIQAVYPAPGTPILRPTLASTTIVPPEIEMLNTYKEMLEGNNLSEEMRSSLLTKIAIYSRIAAQRARAIKIADTPSPPVIRHLPTATLITGLQEGGTSDFHSWEAEIKNIWSQYVDPNEYVVVYAGELGSETEYPGRGVVFVLRETGDRRNKSFNQVLLPEGTGWVRISEIKGDYLVLTSKEGKIFYFYIPGQQLVPSLTEAAPTVTPLPTARPFPTLGPLPTKWPSYPFPGP